MQSVLSRIWTYVAVFISYDDNHYTTGTSKLFTYKSYMYIHLNVCKQMTDDKLLVLHRNSWNHLTVSKQMINRK